MRVVLADDHPRVRRVLRLSLEGDGIEVVGEAETGRQAVHLVQTLDPDVVLLDREMPEVGGLEAARILLEHDPGEKIIVLTSDDDAATISEAARIGARAYVLKAEPAEYLVRIVHLVGDGGVGPRMERAVTEDDGA